jgi:predicted phage terminase large subunit-like protein
MTLQRRIAHLERQLSRKDFACATITAAAMKSLSDREYDLYNSYIDSVMAGAKPTPDQFAAVNHYQREVEAECRAAGFRSLKEFEDANLREIDWIKPKVRYVFRDGVIFKIRFWRFWKKSDWAVQVGSIVGGGGAYRDTTVTLPKTVDGRIQSWIIVSGNSGRSDLSVGQVWAFDSRGIYLEHQIRARLDVPRTIEAVRTLNKTWPEPSSILIANTAEGATVLGALAGEIPNITAVDVADDPLEGARAMNEIIKGGQVYLPHPTRYGWVAELIEECASFPGGREKSQVGAMAQALTAIPMPLSSLSSKRLGARRQK